MKITISSIPSTLLRRRGRRKIGRIAYFAGKQNCARCFVFDEKNKWPIRNEITARIAAELVRYHHSGGSVRCAALLGHLDAGLLQYL